MDNAAFADNGGAELARILREIADSVDASEVDETSACRLRDLNGNTVGTFTVSE